MTCRPRVRILVRMTEYRRRRLLYLVRRVLRGYELEPKERREVARLLKEWEATR